MRLKIGCIHTKESGDRTGSRWDANNAVVADGNEDLITF